MDIKLLQHFIKIKYETNPSVILEQKKLMEL